MTTTQNALPWSANDGGRAAAGFGGSAGDCVVRAICIATCQDYEKTYTDIFALAKSTPSGGVSQRYYRPYLEERGWRFVYAGRRRLTEKNLPSHRKIIALMSRHAVAIVDGTIHDTYDCSNAGKRQFYSYFYKEDPVEVRARIARRIRGLLQRTVENGATEAESEAAVALASRLMAQHALTFRDIAEVREEEYAEARCQIGTYTKSGAIRRYPIDGCLNAIAAFACCKQWYRGTDAIFYGTQVDTDLATGLVNLYHQQLVRDLADYQRSPDGRASSETPAARRANYISYWTGARNTRLRKLTAERNAPPPRAPVRYTEGTELPAPAAEQAKSRELMIVREQVLREKFESHTKDWKWGRARSSGSGWRSGGDPRTRDAARSAEARGDLGISKKVR
jgi:hypothetical protein